METERAECNGYVKLENSPSDDLITHKRRRDDESSADATKVLARPGRNRDIGWNHCVKVGEGKSSYLRCNWCGTSIGSITKIKYHLAGEWGICKCPKVPAKVRKSMMNQLAEMRMKKKRLAENHRFDGNEMSNPCKDDIVYVDSSKSDKEIQVESAGIFNLKADKQFEDTKAASKSSKSTDQHSGTASHLPKNDMTKKTGQVGVIQKNSVVPHATKQFTVGPDCSSKPNHMEASNPNCTSICNKCGTEANGGNSLPCGGCDAIHHFSRIDCSIREIPNRSWHGAACPSTDKDSDPVCTDNKKEFDEVSVTEEYLNENGSRIKTTTNSRKTSVSSIAEARADFSCLSEQLNNISQQLNSMSAIQAELEIAKSGREAAEMQAAEERGKSELLASELERAKEELINYKASEEGRWANQKKIFLKSPEFFELLGARSASVFEYGYRCAMKQFREADYSHQGTSTSSFLDPQATFVSIPEDRIMD